MKEMHSIFAEQGIEIVNPRGSELKRRIKRESNPIRLKRQDIRPVGKDLFFSLRKQNSKPAPVSAESFEKPPLSPEGKQELSKLRNQLALSLHRDNLLIAEIVSFLEGIADLELMRSFIVDRQKMYKAMAKYLKKVKKAN